MLLVEVFADALHGSGLIRAVHNILLRHHVDDILAPTLLYQFLQVLATMETIDGTGGIAQTVDDVRLKSVGIIHHWLYAVFSLQALGIKFSLRLAHHGIDRCFLCLNHSQRHAIGIKQHIVGIALA